MKPGTGRMAVVAPHGVLFRGAAEGRIRQKLIEENLLDTVIGLPDKLFYGTGIPAAILVLRKNKKDDKVLFVDASRDFKAGKNQNYANTRTTRSSAIRCYTKVSSSLPASTGLSCRPRMSFASRSSVSVTPSRLQNA